MLREEYVCKRANVTDVQAMRRKERPKWRCMDSIRYDFQDREVTIEQEGTRSGCLEATGQHRPPHENGRMKECDMQAVQHS